VARPQCGRPAAVFFLLGHPTSSASDCLSYLQVFEDERSDLIACVVIFLGANDASCPNLFPQTHVALEEYQTNLTTIIHELESKFGIDKQKIILVSPPPVNRKLLEEGYENAVNAGALDPLPVAHTNETTSRYARACCQVGKVNSMIRRILLKTNITN
jgi:hypothetical protein